MSKEKFLPKLRFEEFEKNKKWTEKKLGEIADITKLAGFEFTKHVVYSNKGSIIAIRGLNVKNGKLNLKEVKYIDGSNFNKLNRSKLYKGDILFTYVGTIGELAIIPENDRYYLAPNVARIRLENNLSSYFIASMMGNKRYLEKIIYPLISTSSQPALSMENIRKFNLYFPTIEEQNKIGNFFQKIDKIIQLQQSKVNKVEDIKAAYLSELFPKEGESYPEKRFKGFTEPWETYNLGEIAQIKTGNTNVQDAVANGKYIFFDRSTDIKRINKYYYDEEAIIYPGEGSEFYPRYFNGKYALHQRAYSITSENINMEYLKNMMMLKNDYFINNAVGSTVKSLRMENFKNCKILLPSLSEQRKIAELFKNINYQITIQEEKLSKLEKLKEGYLNDLFV